MRDRTTSPAWIGCGRVAYTLSLACAALLAFVVPARRANAERLSRPPQPVPFIITFWCGPPLAEFDDARAAEIAAAGFTTVGAPCEGKTDPAANRRALDVAARHGLRMWIKDARLEKSAPKRPGWQERIDAAVGDYRDHVALGGYFVTDEPSAGEFATVAKVVARLHHADPAHIAYVNLLPAYMKTSAYGTDRYADYLDRFVSVVHPRLISYDYYSFLKPNDPREKDRPQGFFGNLSAVRDLAIRHHLPFMLIVQAMPHWRYRDVTEGELAWQVYHALAYGARGVSYFAYWTPTGRDEMNFHYGLVEDGRPTLHYFEAAALNHRVAAIADQLADFHSLVVADPEGKIGVPFPIGPIEGIEGGPVTAGLFADDGGQLEVLLVNRDYKYGVSAAIRLRSNAQMPEVFDAGCRLWHATDSAVFTLAPGDARLLRWR
jgi:hypothetical protein